jgi:hypothetical protein
MMKNTYYLDLGWQGGIVVVAESLEKAVELAKNSYHGRYVENLESKLTLLKPNEVYTFMGDS